MNADESKLYLNAANCSLYEEDPQPERINVATDVEPHMVRSTEGWRDFYARSLLRDLEADRDRLVAVHDWARHQMPQAPASVPGSDVFGQNEWAIAIELCDRALVMIAEVGADDEFARRRLLAGVENALMMQTLGAIPGVAENAGETLIENLRQIDEDERRARGGSAPS